MTPDDDSPQAETPAFYRLHPIGVIHSPFRQRAETPIQGIFARSARGQVEVLDAYAAGLRDLDLFSHIYLLYAFHEAHATELTVVPYLDDRPHGVYATRHPARPNHIGLSIVRLVSRTGNVLDIVDVDVLDGTPLLDIKPYVPRFDHRPDATSGWLRQVDEAEAYHGPGQ